MRAHEQVTLSSTREVDDVVATRVACDAIGPSQSIVIRTTHRAIGRGCQRPPRPANGGRFQLEHGRLVRSCDHGVFIGSAPKPGAEPEIRQNVRSDLSPLLAKRTSSAAMRLASARHEIRTINQEQEENDQWS